MRARESLATDISKFQEKWRDLWLESIIAQGGGWMNMTDVFFDEWFGVYSPDVLRLHALNCYIDDAPLRQLFGSRASRVSSRGGTRDGAPLILSAPLRISGRSNRRPACPQWIPRVIPAMRPTVARAVSVDVRTLEPVTYVFRVEMTRRDGVSARGERTVEIVP